MSDWIFYEEHHTMRCPYCETIHADHITRRYCPMCGNYMHDEDWDAVWDEMRDKAEKGEV